MKNWLCYFILCIATSLSGQTYSITNYGAIPFVSWATSSNSLASVYLYTGTWKTITSWTPSLYPPASGSSYAVNNYNGIIYATWSAPQGGLGSAYLTLVQPTSPTQSISFFWTQLTTWFPTDRNTTLTSYSLVSNNGILYVTWTTPTHTLGSGYLSSGGWKQIPTLTSAQTSSIYTCVSYSGTLYAIWTTASDTLGSAVLINNPNSTTIPFTWQLISY